MKSHCGIYASDPDAYDTFSDVFYPIIKDYHKVSKLEHPAPDFGDLDNLGFGDLDPEGKYVNSTRIRVGRSHANYGFPPTTSKDVMCIFLSFLHFPLSTLISEHIMHTMGGQCLVVNFVDSLHFFV